jgi:hypothetical protein
MTNWTQKLPLIYLEFPGMDKPPTADSLPTALKEGKGMKEAQEALLQFESERERRNLIKLSTEVSGGNNKPSLNDAENYILEYLVDHKIKRTTPPESNLKLLKAINILLSAQKPPVNIGKTKSREPSDTDVLSELLVNIEEIKPWETFNSQVFYPGQQLQNISEKSLISYMGIIGRKKLDIQFLCIKPGDEMTPKLNLKLIDKTLSDDPEESSVSLLLDENTESSPLRTSFKESLNTFISLIQGQEPPDQEKSQLRQPKPPKAH